MQSVKDEVSSDPTKSEKQTPITLSGVDCVCMIAFDLGKEIDIMQFGDLLLKKIWKLEAIIRPLKEPRDKDLKPSVKFANDTLENNFASLERIGKANNTMVGILMDADESLLTPSYRLSQRFFRLKLSDFTLEIPGTKLECVPEIMIHDTGIGIMTIWISFPNDLNVEQLNCFVEAMNKECIISILNDAATYKASLIDYVKEYVWQVVSSEEKVEFLLGKTDVAEIKKRNDFRVKSGAHPLIVTSLTICAKTIRYDTAELKSKEDIMKHGKELSVLLNGPENWPENKPNNIKDYSDDEIREKIVFQSSKVIMLVTKTKGLISRTNLPGALLLGTSQLGKDFEKVQSTSDINFLYKSSWLNLIHPFSFLIFQRFLLEMLSFKLTQQGKDTASQESDNLEKLSSLRDVVRRGLENNQDVGFIGFAGPIMDKISRIIELDKMRSTLSEKINLLGDVLNTRYQQNINNTQLKTNKAQIALASLFGLLGITGVIQVILALRDKFSLDNNLVILFSVITIIAIPNILVYLLGKYKLPHIDFTHKVGPK